MKKILYLFWLFLPVLGVAQSRYGVEGVPMCWTTALGVDSSIVRYVLISTTGQPVKTISYENAQGAVVNVSGGVLRYGFCDCAGGLDSLVDESVTWAKLADAVKDSIRIGMNQKRDTFITVPPNTNYFQNIIDNPARFYNNVYLSCKGRTDTSIVAFLANPVFEEQKGVVYNIKNDSGLVAAFVLNYSHFSNSKSFYMLNRGQTAQVRLLPDAANPGQYGWAVNVVWDSVGSGSGVDYITQNSAPSDTTKLWLDNSAGMQEVWQFKQRVQGNWKTIQWYCPIGKVFSPLPPAYILATGQSNMLGYGSGTLGDTVQDARVSVWNNSSSWVTSRIHFAPYRTDGYYNNLAFHFAKKLAQTENRIVRLILQAYPGQPIEYWATGATAWTGIGTAVSASGSSTKTFSAILWHQGESNGDGYGPCVTDNCYRDSLYHLISRFNATAWVDNTTKFIAGGLSVNGTSGHKGREDVLKELNSDTLTYTGFADAYGFTLGDVHFTNAELVEFGSVRYWNAYKALPTLKYIGGATTNNTYVSTQAGVKLFKEAHGYAVGAPIRKEVSGVISKGYSTSVDSFPDFIVVNVISADTVLVSNSGTYNIGSHGLQEGQIYYVDSIGGRSVYPDTNRWIVPIFKVVDGTKINIFPIKGYKNKVALDYEASGGGLDPDVYNFLTTAAIVNDTIKYALHELVTSLKANSLWTKTKALYPFVGGTSVTHSYNLKDPTLYTISWQGTVTHNYNGITGNGTTGYGNTGITSANLLTADNIGATWVVRNAAASSINWGATSGTGTNFHGSSNFSSNNRIHLNSETTVSDGTAGAGIYIGWRSGANVSLSKDGTAATTTNVGTASASTSQQISIGAWNNNGTRSLFSNANQAFWMLHEALTNTEKDTVFAITERFQRRVGRSFLNTQEKRVWTGGGVFGDLMENNLVDLTPTFLIAQDTLDFPSTGTNTTSDLIIPVPGAKDGDPVSLGVPTLTWTGTSMFNAWVSGPGIVTVRFYNGSSVGAQNPDPGIFKLLVFRLQTE